MHENTRRDVVVPQWALFAGLTSEGLTLLNLLHLLHTEVEEGERIVPPISDDTLVTIIGSGALKTPSKSSLRRWREILEKGDAIKVENIDVITSRGRQVLRKYRLRVEPGPGHNIRSTEQALRLLGEAHVEGVPEDEIPQFIENRAASERAR